MTGVGIRILDWSTISPIGIGREAYSAAVQEALHRPRGPRPGKHTGVKRLRGFSTLERSGRIDRLSAIAVEMAKLVDWEPVRAAADGSRRTAVVVGTATGSLPGMVRVTHDSLRRRKGHIVNPRDIPSLMLNAAAGHIAIDRSLCGPNSTMAAGHLSGLSALATASRYLRSGRADFALVGAVDEASVQRQLAERLLRGQDAPPGPPLGEGGVCLLLQAHAKAGPSEVPTRSSLPAVLGVRVGYSAAVGTGQSELLAEVIRQLVTEHRVRPSDISVSLCQCGPAAARAAELSAVNSLFGVDSPRSTVATDLLGDTYSAVNLFQLVSALAVHEAGAQGRRPFSLIAATGADGEVAAALVRL